MDSAGVKVGVDQKRAFLEDALFSTAKRDAFSTRSGRRVYREGISDGDRTTLVNGLQATVKEMARDYVNPIDESKHLANIRKLTERPDWAVHLNGGSLTFGVAQKLFNSYLKYLWCLNEIATPPHCPFDSYILNKLDLCGCETRWTYANEKDYVLWVNQAKTVARDATLAEWEVGEWNAIMEIT